MRMRKGEPTRAPLPCIVRASLALRLLMAPLYGTSLHGVF
jgi:hypothetical protein